MTAPDPFSLPPVPPAAPRRNLWPLLIGGALVGVLLIVIGVSALAFNLLTQRSSNIPELLPAETQIYAAITPNLSDLPNIDRLRRAFPETFDYQNSDTTTDFLRERFGVSFVDDIATWIGPEAAVAVYGLPIEQLLTINSNRDPFAPPATLDPLNNIDLGEANALFIVAVRDERAAQAFLDKQRAFRESKGERFRSSTTGGVTIYASENDETPFAAFALARRMVVFASNAASISALIEQRSDSSLARNADFRAVQESLPGDRIGAIYVAGQTIADAVAEATKTGQLDENAAVLSDAIAASRALRGIGLTMAVIESGIRFDVTTVFDRDRLGNDLRERINSFRPAVSPARIGDVSSKAIGAFSFAIPADWGKQLRDQLESSPDTATTLRDIERSLRLDLDRDLFQWFHGESVIAVMPATDEAFPAGGYFALRVADQAAAERGMAQIAGALEDLFGIRLDSIAIGRTQVQGFEDSGIFIGYGFNGSDLVIAFGRSAMEAAFDPGTKLANVATYTNALKAMPSPNSGVFYLNLAAARELNEQLDNQTADVDQRLEPFRAITSSGSVGLDNRGALRGTLLLSIEGQR